MINDGKRREIPTLESKLEDIINLLKKNSVLGLIYIDSLSIDTPQFFYYGDYVEQSIAKTIFNLISNFPGSCIREEDLVTVNIPKGNKYYIFLSKARLKKLFHVKDYERLAQRIQFQIDDLLYSSIFPITNSVAEIKIGFSICFYNPSLRNVAAIQNLIDHAEQVAHYRQAYSQLIKRELLYRIISNEDVVTHYQPVVNLKNHDIIGYEAFTLGHHNTYYKNPYCLFSYAKDIDLLSELDWIAKKNAIINAKGLAKKQKLFIKFMSSSLFDTEVRVRYLLELIEKNGMTPVDIIFELSEKYAIENSSMFLSIKNLYKNMGLAIVINDSWTPATFDLLEKLTIDYIKVNMTLIRNIHIHKFNQILLRSLKKVTDSTGTKVIVEGIQQIEELKTLIDIGFDLGQGYLFAKPGPPFPPVDVVENYIEDVILHTQLLQSVYFKRGRDYFNSGEFDKSILEFSKCLEINANDRDALYYRAYAYLQDNSALAALLDIDKLVKIEPEYLDAYYLKAVIHEKIGEKAEAIRNYENFINKANPAKYKTELELANESLKKLS
jgi:EAL domain-containing protein (putative c-di-GMP-specific phosphodiesterase class I)